MSHGHCTCTRHSFTIHGRPSNVANCHCTQCRRHSGAPWSTWLTVDEAQYVGPLKAGFPDVPRGDVTTYSTALAQRSFCSHCGSPLLMRYYCTPRTLHIPLGLLDPLPPGHEESFREAFTPRQDIWTGSRAWWVSLGGEREQFERDDPEFIALCDRWKADHAAR